MQSEVPVLIRFYGGGIHHEKMKVKGGTVYVPSYTANHGSVDEYRVEKYGMEVHGELCCIQVAILEGYEVNDEDRKLMEADLKKEVRDARATWPKGTSDSNREPEVSQEGLDGGVG